MSLFVRRTHPSKSVTTSFFANLFASEDRHFWFRARNRVLEHIFGDLVTGLPSEFRVLEVGCGTGNVLRILERVCTAGEVVGLDLNEESLKYARQRVRCRLMVGDIHNMPFSDPFDLIGMFDVLEHLPDDRRILRALKENLRPGGRLLITVPAHQSLWSYADEFGMYPHYRRYAPAQLRQVLQEAGFRVEFLSQFMMALYPLIWLGRKWNAASFRSGKDSQRNNLELVLSELQVHPVINSLCYGLLSWESAWLVRRFRLPFGTSLLAIAQA